MMGCLLTPTMVRLFQHAIKRFLIVGSIPKVVGYALKPASLFKMAQQIHFPKLSIDESLPLGFLQLI